MSPFPVKFTGLWLQASRCLVSLRTEVRRLKLIRESNCGLLVEPHSYEEVVRSVLAFYEWDREELEACGMRGRAYLEQYLRRELSLERYRELLLSLKIS